MADKNYRYYQPNKKDLKDKCGDCSIRAITKFFGMSWVEAFDSLVVYARETQQMLNSLPNIKLLMQMANMVLLMVIFIIKMGTLQMVQYHVPVHMLGEW